MFRRQDIDHDDLRSVVREELGMIIIKTPIQEIFVNGESYEIPTNAGFRGHGKIRATYQKTNGLTFSGTFHAAWMDERRLNLTQWERWTIETRIKILILILSIIGSIATLVYRTRDIWGKHMLQ